ncbi:MAG: FGGY-family carbohydrate kinase [Oscillospiraceae bacterium]|nr:FGGY-family carbohydrate kinase [Oscillospiraceae bacterium]MBR4655509.1 FGGY-family carbohydrate kinase [Oscillospiraceae bacterium]
MLKLKQCALGIELGSTRIKAVLIDENHIPVASGDFEWENQLVNGIWTYSLDLVHTGVQTCFANLKKDVKDKFGIPLRTVGALGVSAMMHGYLPFDQNGNQLAEFRTWRNTMTGPAAAELTELFGFNIPQRWSIAHLWQAVLNGEDHLPRLDYLTTLAGYIHRRLTGERSVGVGEASGIFPIDSEALDYDQTMLDKLDVTLAARGFSWRLRDVLPRVKTAGDSAGALTPEGAAFLDPAGDLLPGIPLAPCEGDAGTGMAATNSVRARTGNVSAGTSDFAMIVTEKPLGVHREIDMVTTPTGLPVAMVHCNNCTSDINAWVKLFAEYSELMGMPVNKGELYTKLFRKALEGDADCGGLLSFNYLSGEGVTDLNQGRPLFLRQPDAKLSLANFMRTHLLSALATLKIGMDILTDAEQVPIDKLYGHGGYFKTPVVGQRLLSAAVNAPVSIMETAGEGGPYGMALLAAYLLNKAEGESLEDYLDNKVFAEAETVTLMAEPADVEGFNAFLKRYKAALPVEKLATEVF